jgi:acyl carrier protein
MSNLEIYNRSFAEVFSVDAAALNDDFTKETATNWDSIRQLAIVTALEDSFDIMFDTPEIVAFTSYKKGKEILTNYNIEI